MTEPGKRHFGLNDIGQHAVFVVTVLAVIVAWRVYFGFGPISGLLYNHLRYLLDVKDTREFLWNIQGILEFFSFAPPPLPFATAYLLMLAVTGWRFLALLALLATFLSGEVLSH